VDDLIRATARAERRHFWFRGFRSFVTPLIALAVNGRPNSRVRILDCGCGTGNNLELLGRFGHAYGFDVSALGLQIGQSGGRTRMARATVTAAPFPENCFDLVTSFDVLYALDERQAREAITEMYRLARPGGYALVNVAAFKQLRGNHSVLGREVSRYDRSTLGRLMTEAGFHIVRLTYTNASLFLPLLISRFLERRRGPVGTEELEREAFKIPPSPINALLGVFLELEARWIRRFDVPFGSSLLCLARKPL
jgi:SAM-dependent methyltransferase